MSGEDLVPSGGEPATAQTVVADVVDALSPDGVMLPPSWLAIVGRHAKALLQRGFPPDVVRTASYIAIRRRHPEITQHIAGDLMLARAGQIMDRTEYEARLASANDTARPAGLLEAHHAREAAREQEIRQLRGES